MTDSSFLPSDLGLPSKFTRYYSGQEKAILHLASDDKRVSIFNASTGSGKSPIVISVASLLDARTLILTPSKALQAQYYNDFAPMGLYNIEGHSNFQCATASHNRETGEYDFECTWKEDCLYKEACREARGRQLVLTNVAHWVHMHRRDPDRLGKFDLLVIDEAHNAERLLCDYVSERLAIRQAEKWIPTRMPAVTETSAILWSKWLTDSRTYLRKQYKELSALSGKSVQRDDLTKLGTSLSSLIDLLETGKWKVNPEKGFNGLRVSPVWAYDFVESHLFRSIPRIILCSATMPETAAKYLALTPADYSYYEMPSTFPSQNRPVYYFPFCSETRVDHKMGDGERRLWVNRIDSILSARPDVKGIIHAVSYDRAEYIKEHSKFSDRVLIHRQGQSRAAVAQYKRSSQPVILCSPAIEEGFDFPGDECRLIIFPKVPWIYAGDPITAARLKEDKTYSTYITAQRVKQMLGRGNRYTYDWCEVVFIDGHWSYFRKMKHFERWYTDCFKGGAITQMPERLVPAIDATSTSTRGIIRRRK